MHIFKRNFDLVTMPQIMIVFALISALDTIEVHVNKFKNGQDKESLGC